MLEPPQTTTTPSPRPSIQDPFAHDPSLVVTLDSSSFRQAVAANPRLLVMFYNPGCRLCREFAPEFARAAREARRSGMGIVFAQVQHWGKNQQNEEHALIEKTF